MSLFDDDLIVKETDVDAISSVIIDVCNEIVPSHLRNYISDPEVIFRSIQTSYICCMMDKGVDFWKIRSTATILDHYDKGIPVYKCEFSVALDPKSMRPGCRLTLYVSIGGVKNVEYEFI